MTNLLNKQQQTNLIFKVKTTETFIEFFWIYKSVNSAVLWIILQYLIIIYMFTTTILKRWFVCPAIDLAPGYDTNLRPVSLKLIMI